MDEVLYLGMKCVGHLCKLEILVSVRSIKIKKFGCGVGTTAVGQQRNQY